jgi:hypothetical protein
VWIGDRVTGKTSIRTVSRSAGTEAPSRLALRSAEMLRASLREFRSRSPPPGEIVGAEPQRASAEVLRWADTGAAGKAKRAHNANWWLQLEAAALVPLPQPRIAFDPAGWPAAGLTNRVKRQAARPAAD